MKKAILIFLSILFGCGNDNVEKTYLDQVNQKFVDEAHILFNGKTRDLRGYSSYTANRVSYKIESKDFNINIFFEDKKALDKIGWKYYLKYNQSYIFCDGERQMEIIKPRILAGNKDLVEGANAMQLNNDWHIIFYKPNNTTSYKCYNYKE